MQCLPHAHLAIPPAPPATPVAWSNPAPAAPRASASIPALPMVPVMAQMLAAVVDEVDYGLLLVTPEARLVHANRAAVSHLADDHPLVLDGAQLHARRRADDARLHDAIEAGARGLRRLLRLEHRDDEVPVAVVPVAPLNDGPGAVLLVLGKRHVTEDLSIDWFARAKGLTCSETEVLKRLCEGLDPKEIAARQGVAISTVRTQISRIREKTQASGIRELLRQVMLLPPMVSSACCARYHRGHAAYADRPAPA
jgi:DNA-binding CsgD family transcriptional regulator